MNNEIIIVFAVFIGAAILFITNRVRNDLVAVLVMLSLMVSGVLSVNESVAGFADPILMVIIAMFIVSEALVNTGIAQRIGEMVLTAGQGNETRLIVTLMLAVGGLGAFMSSTATVAIFIPITLSVAAKANLNPKRLLMPLSIGCLISGMMTMVATTPNLVVTQAMVSRGLDPFGFFSFTPFGAAILVIGILFILFTGRNMLSKEKRQSAYRRRTVKDFAIAYGLEHKAHVLSIPPGSSMVDLSVASTQAGEKFGLQLIALIKRLKGQPVFMQPPPETVIEAGDDILIVGTNDQVDQFAVAFGLDRMVLDRQVNRKAFLQEFGLAEIILTPESKMIGKTLAENQLRTRYKVNVLGIRRRGKPITERISSVSLDFGDALLVNAAWTDILRLRDEHEQFVVLTLPEESSEVIPSAALAPKALIILGAMVTAMASGQVPTVMAALVAAVLLVLTQCVKIGSVYRVIKWESVVLIGGILPLATALNKSGATHLMSMGLVDTLSGLGPYGMLVVIFILTATTGLFISNTATAVLIAPIAIDAAISINASPQAFAMTVAIACSAAYVTPVSSPVNGMVLEPGGYRFMDYVKVGIPMQLLTLIATVVLVGAIYMH